MKQIPVRDPASTRPPPPGASLAVIVGLAYGAAALASWDLSATIAVAMFYPPAAIAVAALLLTARRHWGWALAAIALTEFLVSVRQVDDAGLALALATASAAGPLVGVGLLRRMSPGAVRLSRRGDAARFLVCCAVAGPAVSAAIGATALRWGLQQDYWYSYGAYWAGDALPVATLGAAITAFAYSRRPTRRNVVIGLAILVATAALTFLGFWSTHVPMAYLPLPVLLAAAFTGRVDTVAAAGFVMAVVANAVTGAGQGIWANLARDPRPEAALLQVYLAGAMLTAWILTIEITERDRARETTREEAAARRRLQVIQEVTAGLATAATSKEIQQVMVDRAVAVVADLGAVAVLDAGAGVWRIATAGGPAGGEAGGPAGDAGRRHSQIPHGQIPHGAENNLPVTYCAANGIMLSFDSPAEIVRRFPSARQNVQQTRTASLLVVPVFVANRSRGALALGFLATGRPSSETASLAITLAGLAGQALERAELYESEYRAAHQLQQSLLPKIGPDLPGVEAGVCYRPAQIGHDVGGDWYDVFEIPGNRVGITVGDVVGHDLEAAIAMGQLQNALRSLAMTGSSPAEILHALDDAATRIEGAECATVGYAEYSPSEGLLRYACAGHPPPLLVRGGRSAYLGEGRSPPLGIALDPRPQAEVAVAPGSVLVWYSDGLVETRGRDLREGLERLAEVASGSDGLDVQVRAETLVATMTAGRPIHDDVVVVCLHLHRVLSSAASSVVRETVHDVSGLTTVRKTLRAWAAGQHLSAEQTESLLLVCSEALTNSLEHAADSSGPRPVELTVVRADLGHVRVEVSDRGRWRPQAGDDAEHGRGLMVISRLAQRATLELRVDGTRLVAYVPTEDPVTNP